MPGVFSGIATSGANYVSTYCALGAQHSIVRMIKRLTFSSSTMDPLMSRALLLQVEDPCKMARQVATRISAVLLKKVTEISFRV
jgi:hypothetical protein